MTLKKVEGESIRKVGGTKSLAVPIKQVTDFDECDHGCSPQQFLTLNLVSRTTTKVIRNG